MGWLRRNWRKVVTYGCGAAGAVALVYPPLLPVAAACGVVVPLVNLGRAPTPEELGKATEDVAKALRKGK